ncbi:hypothetical protein NM688_g8824 [Phlebia brevispora]|uniref:Uncharacterized protein n=1 Tax=Phlebia brevispora TaxID=194682 RepID=A0ACC1RPF6_9APHY|nr:hypothetical protein NM688_g8824 [Phlebia brevispora]
MPLSCPTILSPQPEEAVDELPPPYEDPLHSTVSSTTEPPRSSSFFAKMRNFAPGADPISILNPPPPCFSRVPPTSLSYETFRPCILLSLSNELDKGFPAIIPPSSAEAHPFILHDVREEDWIRFLRDIQRAGSLSPMNRFVAGAVPITFGLGYPGILVTRSIERAMKKKKIGPVSEIIEHWNHYFFSPREIEITLVQGEPSTRTSSDDSSSISSSLPSSPSLRSDSVMELPNTLYTHDNRSTRTTRTTRSEREEREAERAAKRAQRQEMKRRSREKWRLIVNFKALF